MKKNTKRASSKTKSRTHKKSASTRTHKKKSASFMSSIKKMFFPVFLAMMSVASLNADCGRCNANQHQ